MRRFHITSTHFASSCLALSFSLNFRFETLLLILVRPLKDAQRGRLSITSHEELSLFLRSKNVIRSDAVFDAFALTDRGFYAGNRAAEMTTQAGREAARTSTYWDRPLSIGAYTFFFLKELFL